MNGTASPSFSVVVPTYRRPDALRACLRGLARLDYPRDCYEVIVVDDGGGLDAADALAAYRPAENLVTVVQKHGGPGAARNAGAAMARHDHLAFTDDDCVADPGWLKACAARHGAAQPPAMIGGCTRNILTDNVYSSASQHLVDCLYDYFSRHDSPARFFATSNMVVPRREFHALRGFDAVTMRDAAAEDREFCARWLERGWAMRYAPDAVVFHAHSLTLRSFWRQHFAYGRGAYLFRLSRARRGRAPFGIDAGWLWASVLKYPFSRARGCGALRLAALMLLTHAANTVGFLAERRECGKKGGG